MITKKDDDRYALECHVMSLNLFCISEGNKKYELEILKEQKTFGVVQAPPLTPRSRPFEP